ncbi:TCP-1/cpn60 chaperonin family [Phytophthora infestans]|uniref:TCP-1/cpn60 chaperonin family n=1 Tax=Phytophthora infestans TaxID=4787 RepID=A0A833TBJ1_PHYIN|nr:TCP-1/cpn60 chaperonin family [Phytophthora infestans]KAF4127187.1 TCP-1/cpn60 chaperonin family [Phytophthora infestans]
MGFAAELERVTEDLAALCRRSFGPCGEETLLFRPPDAPIVTGEGSAVLAAWKRGLDSNDPLAIFLLTAANGVHLQLGDASSEFILLVDAAVKHVSEQLRREQHVSLMGRARLSRAFGELKWDLQREMERPNIICGLKLAVPIQLDAQTMEPSHSFRDASANILVSALRGLLGEQIVDFVVDLVLKWLFAKSPCKNCNATERPDYRLFRRTQQFLKCASDAIISMTAPSVYASYVVPNDEFILKKSVVASQPPGILDRCRDTTQFACFTCPLSLSAGSNNVELAVTTDEEFFTAHDAAHLFVSRFVRRLRERLCVQLIISVEALDDSVIAACTRQGIACVQLAEPKDVEALCIRAGIFPLASVFDDIRPTDHIGVCTNGVSRGRFQQQACLRLRGLSRPDDQSIEKVNSEHRLEEIVVPQLLLHAPTKGVYKQYYAAIVKSLRVLRSWWEPADHSASIAYSCRGGGATELAVARWLQDSRSTFSSDALRRDPSMFSMAREIMANALIEVVSILRNNLTETSSSGNDERSNQRQVLLDAFSNLNLKDRQKFPGYILDYSRVIETLAGPIQIPELVVGDPATFGLVHPWRRIDTLLFLVVQTLEQLLRIDKVFPITSARTTE